MFAIVQNNEIIKTIQPHTAFELFGKTYNAKWTVRLTAAEKAALGIKDIAVTPRPDERFYWVQQNDIQLVNGVPFISFTATPKLLNDREEVDEDGEPLLDSNGNQVITRGLKSQWIDQTKDSANKALAATDWYVIRKAERDVAIPDEVIAERAKIIKDCTDKEAAIKAATTIEELIAAVS